MAKRELPSPERLRQLLRYEPDTGKLFHIEREPSLFASARGYSLWKTRFFGKEAGHITPNGYRRLRVDGVQIAAHRVAWAIHHGRFPPHQLDHINGVRHDNRLSNLREVTAAENSLNRARGRNNSSGMTGVTWFATRGGQWRAMIGYKGNRIHLGLYPTFEQAAAARRAAEIKYRFHPNSGKRTSARR